MNGIELMLLTVCNITCLKSPTIHSIETSQYPVIYNDLHKSKAISYQAMRDMINGRHITVGTYPNPPLSDTYVDDSGEVIGTGVAFTILDDLKRKLNFTYHIVLPSHYEVSKKGIIGSLFEMLMNHKIDMAAAFIAPSKEYDGKITFSFMGKGQWMMFFNRPTNSFSSQISRTFSPIVWVFFLATILLYVTFFVILTRIRSLIMHNDGQCSTWRSSFIYVWKIWNDVPENSPRVTMTRILLMSWSLFKMIIVTYYTAHLTARLTIPEFIYVVKSPEDLITRNISWASSKGGMLEYILNDQSDVLHRYSEMVKSGRAKFYSTFDRMSYIDAALKQKHIVIEDSSRVEYYLYRKRMEIYKKGSLDLSICKIEVAPEPFMTAMRGFAYPRNSTLKKLFDILIRSLRVGGFLENKDFSAQKKKLCNRDSKYRVLQTYHLTGCYNLLITGALSAVIIFIIEVSIDCLKKTLEELFQISFERIYGHRLVYNCRPTSDTPIHIGSSYNSELDSEFPRLMFNGREYLITNTSEGETRIIPVNTPSALLYNLNLYKNPTERTTSC